MQVDGYIRVSDTRGRSGPQFISPEIQRREIQKYAAANDIEILTIHEELDVSGRRMSRPKLDEVIRRIEAKETDGVIVAYRSRFARSLEGALVAMRRIDEAGGAFLAADGLRTDTPEGRGLVNVLLSFAQLESDRIKDNWAAGRRSAVERGIHVTPRARVPLGYSMPEAYNAHGDLIAVPLELDPDRATLVREAFEMRVAGRSWRTIALHLGVGFSGARTILRNRVYLGEARSGGFVMPAAHPAIVDLDTWERAQPGEVTIREGRYGDQGLLRGLIRCASCGYRMQLIGRTKQRMSMYRCRNIRCAASASIAVPKTDEFVLNAAIGAVGFGEQDSTAIIARRRAAYAAAVAALVEARAERTALVEKISPADPDFATWVARSDEKVAEARRQLATQPRPENADRSLGPAEGYTVRSMKIEQQREWLRRYIARITVAPAHRRTLPTAERLQISWH